MSLAKQIAARMLGAKKSVMGRQDHRPKEGARGAPAAETGSKSERASGTQPRHLPTRALEQVPPVPMAERRRRIAAGHARRNEPAPATPRTITERPPPLPPVPPRPEFDLVQALHARPLPAPLPEVAPAPSSGSWKGSCKAICADTGRQCRMPAHPNDPDRHRHERGPFFRVAAPGQSFTRRDLLDAAATRHNPEVS